MLAKYETGEVKCIACRDNGQESVYEIEVINKTQVGERQFFELEPEMICPICCNVTTTQWAYFARENELAVLYV